MWNKNERTLGWDVGAQLSSRPSPQSVWHAANNVAALRFETNAWWISCNLPGQRHLEEAEWKGWSVRRTVFPFLAALWWCSDLWKTHLNRRHRSRRYPNSRCDIETRIPHVPEWAAPNLENPRHHLYKGLSWDDVGQLGLAAAEQITPSWACLGRPGPISWELLHWEAQGCSSHGATIGQEPHPQFGGFFVFICLYCFVILLKSCKSHCSLLILVSCTTFDKIFCCGKLCDRSVFRKTYDLWYCWLFVVLMLALCFCFYLGWSLVY